MGNDPSQKKIIMLSEHTKVPGHLADTSHSVGGGDEEYDIVDVRHFIVDMLDTLVRVAARQDQSLLVYFLAMARIEAMEMKDAGSDNQE